MEQPQPLETSAPLADRLWQTALRGLRETGRVLALIALGALAALALALPWLLRGTTVLLWAAGVAAFADALWRAYGPLPAVPRLTLGLTALAVGVSLPAAVLVRREQAGRLWGAFAVTGAGLWLLAWAWTAWLLEHPLLLHAIPALLAVTLQAWLMVRSRRTRESKEEVKSKEAEKETGHTHRPTADEDGVLERILAALDAEAAGDAEENPDDENEAGADNAPVPNIPKKEVS